MILRLTLALLALPLIPFQGSPNPYACPAQPIQGCLETPTQSFPCDIKFLMEGETPSPGNCLARPRRDCLWQFLIQASNCNTLLVSSIRFSYQDPGGGLNQVDAPLVGTGALLGPFAIQADCGHTDSSGFISFLDFTGNEVTHRDLSFQCKKCQKQPVNQGGTGQ